MKTWMTGLLIQAFCMLTAVAESFPVDFSSVANMGFADAAAGDGKGGWTDQGPENDLSMFPTGNQVLGGIPFRIADPEKNGGRGCIVLRGAARPEFPEEITVELSEPLTGKYLYVLNATAWSSGKKTGEVVVEYAQAELVANEMNTFAVYGERETGNFWGAKPVPNAPVGWKGRNRSSAVGLYLSCFELAERPVRRITFRSAGNMVWMIVGATFSGRPPQKIQETEHVVRAGEKWVPIPSSFGIQPGSVLDFSGMQDAPAGKYGFVCVRNGHFEFENRPGKTVRFYGVNLVGDVHFMNDEEIDRIADELAASGYNLVRFHHFDNRMKVKGKPSTVINEKRRERLDYWIAALKRRGLYVSLDLFTIRRPVKDEIPGFSKLTAKEYKALYLINADVRQNLEEFSANLMRHVNPYTGVAWNREPAIALISLINENTIYSVESVMKEEYRKRFRIWLKEKRISGRTDERGLYDAFLLEVYGNAYEEMKRMVHRIGIRVPVSDQNFWMKVPQSIMRDRYDYVDNHLYWSHPSYRNPKQHYSPPFIVANTNAVRFAGGTLPRRFPTKIYGKPFSMSEWNHCVPSAFNMQGVFLIGAYGGYQNWDSLCRFAYSHYAGNIRRNRPMRKPFDLAGDPVSMLSDRVGICFFLRGDVRPAEIQYPVLVNADPLKNGPQDYPLGAERIGLVGGTGSIVINKKQNAFFPSGIRGFLGLSRDLTMFRGRPVFPARKDGLLPAMQAQEALPEKAYQADPESFRSDTGEILLECRRNRFSVVTPRSEGFLLKHGDCGEGEFAVIRNWKAYAGFLIASVDCEPLMNSRRILLLHLPDHKAEGMRFRDAELSFLEDWGTSPLLLAKGEAEVTLNRDLSAFRLYAVDGDGSRLGTIPMRHGSGKSRFTLRSDWNGRGVVAYELVNPQGVNQQEK